jgi:hypothetical protein
VKNVFFILLIIFAPAILKAQGSGIPLGNNSYHIYDRLEIKTGQTSPLYSAIQPYRRGDVAAYAIAIDTTFEGLTSRDKNDLSYIFKDNNEWLGQSQYSTTLVGKNEPVYQKVYIDSTQTLYKLVPSQSVSSQTSDYYITTKKPLFKIFYKTPANLFELNTKAFQFKINPIFNFKYAKVKDGEDIFQNTRGLEARGAIDDRVYFYTNIIETQASFPNYVNNRIDRDLAVPGAGFFKSYQSSVFDGVNGYDYLLAQGYLGFNLTRHIGMQFGHGQNFIGNGYRSMLLSDFGTNYFYLKFNTRVWKFHYQNIFAELSAESTSSQRDNELIAKKYMAAHYLDFKISNNFSIGLFEAVVFSRNNQFELQYLNPIILYRTIEGAIGSPDNVMLGLNVKWNFLKRFQLYGQLLLDELKFSEITANTGWWANKYGIQLGLKYINTFGIDHLDTQFEFNSVRPYTYTHRDSSASYSHFNQVLAHPQGANFREYIFKVRYQPINKLVIDSRLLFMNYGEDSDTTNWGGNILLPYETREMDYGNEIGQGIGTNTFLIGVDLSYELFHNIYLDLHYFYRKQDSQDPKRDLITNYVGGGFRMNIANRRNEF